jgi:hypothetical protein
MKGAASLSGAAPLIGAEEQTACAIGAYAQYTPPYFLCEWGL